MRHTVLGPLIILMIVSGGCAERLAERRPSAASAGVQLIYPPDVPDPHYPGGVHLQSEAPLARWHQVAVFGTRENCESSRIHRIDESIDKARSEVGERAKYQLSVRRAVNARCVDGW